MVYTVQRGDSLSKIGSKFKVYWKTIYALNKKVIGTNPNRIKPGMRLTLPSSATATAIKNGRSSYNVNRSRGLRRTSSVRKSISSSKPWIKGVPNNYVIAGIGGLVLLLVMGKK